MGEDTFEFEITNRGCRVYIDQVSLADHTSMGAFSMTPEAAKMLADSLYEQAGKALEAQK